MRVLHSYPGKIGADRICLTAWHQVEGATVAGADVLSLPAAVHVPFRHQVAVQPTLARGRLRLPFRVLGQHRTRCLHDAVVARRLRSLRNEIDVVHVWPLGAKKTLEAAAELGIPSVLERPNAHTRFAYSVVRDECDRIGVPLPPDHEHAFNAELLAWEEEEYALADYLLCPSEFVVDTFLAEGFRPEKLLRHSYGYDPSFFYPPLQREESDGLNAIFVGVAAVRKGLHFALEAWVRSPAARSGRFRIAGSFLPEYQEFLSPLLAHPSVELLGHRTDVADLMRESDLMLLPSIEEGYGLVCVEAMACGSVPLVSTACTDFCRDGVNALVHAPADVDALSAQITALHEDRSELARLRAGALQSAPDATWDRAGQSLVHAYEQAAARKVPPPSVSNEAVGSGCDKFARHDGAALTGVQIR